MSELPGGLRGVTVYVVDDDESIRAFNCDALRGYGFELIRAFVDGEQALHAAREDPPDLVITDLRMPRMGGRRAAEITSTVVSRADIRPSRRLRP